MTSMTTEYIGYLAGVLTTVAFVPQAVRMIRTGHARDVSLSWIVMMTSGVALWLGYGIMNGSIPMILANSITLVLLAVILIIKIKSR